MEAPIRTTKEDQAVCGMIGFPPCSLWDGTRSCKNEARPTMEISGSYKCQDHGMPAKWDCMQWAEPAWECGHVGCSQQGRGELTLFHVSQMPGVELQDLTSVLLWVSVLLWSHPCFLCLHSTFLEWECLTWMFHHCTLELYGALFLLLNFHS